LDYTAQKIDYAANFLYDIHEKSVEVEEESRFSLWHSWENCRGGRRKRSKFMLNASFVF